MSELQEIQSSAGNARFAAMGALKNSGEANSLTADVMLADAQYLIAHCP